MLFRSKDIEIYLQYNRVRRGSENRLKIGWQSVHGAFARQVESKGVEGKNQKNQFLSEMCVNHQVLLPLPVLRARATVIRGKVAAVQL